MQFGWLEIRSGHGILIYSAWQGLKFQDRYVEEFWCLNIFVNKLTLVLLNKLTLVLLNLDMPIMYVNLYQ